MPTALLHRNGQSAALIRRLRATTRCSTEPHGSNVTGISPSVDEPRGSGAPEKAAPLHNKAALIVGAFTQCLRQRGSCSLSKPRSPVIQPPQIDTILQSPFTSKSQK